MKKKMIELAEEAVELIKNFRRETIVLCGENILEDVAIKINEEDDLILVSIIVKNKYEEKEEYMLSEISDVFNAEYNYPEGLSEGFDLERSLVDKDKMTRNEFLKFMGDLYYAELRCNEIYERLQEIENKASKF